MSPIGSFSTANERGGLLRVVQPDGPTVQLDVDYPPSTTSAATTLWSNSSRYLFLSFVRLSSMFFRSTNVFWSTIGMLDIRKRYMHTEICFASPAIFQKESLID